MNDWSASIARRTGPAATAGDAPLLVALEGDEAGVVIGLREEALVRVLSVRLEAEVAAAPTGLMGRRQERLLLGVLLLHTVVSLLLVVLGLLLLFRLHSSVLKPDLYLPLRQLQLPAQLDASSTRQVFAVVEFLL